MRFTSVVCAVCVLLLGLLAAGCKPSGEKTGEGKEAPADQQQLGKGLINKAPK